MADELLYEVRDGVATLTLNRPEQRNALNAELLSALVEGLTRARDDSEVRVVVLTGGGATALIVRTGGTVSTMMVAGRVVATPARSVAMTEILLAPSTSPPTVTLQVVSVTVTGVTG